MALPRSDLLEHHLVQQRLADDVLHPADVVRHVDEHGRRAGQAAVDAPRGDGGEHRPAAGPPHGQRAARVAPAQTTRTRRHRAQHRAPRVVEEGQLLLALVVAEHPQRHLVQQPGEDGAVDGGVRGAPAGHRAHRACRERRKGHVSVADW